MDRTGEYKSGDHRVKSPCPFLQFYDPSNSKTFAKRIERGNSNHLIIGSYPLLHKNNFIN